MMEHPDDTRRTRVPLWVTVLIIVCMLPVLAFPAMLSLAPADVADGSAHAFLWFYPVYVIASGVCARICYSGRRDVMWILIALMLLSHAAMWMLVLNDNIS